MLRCYDALITASSALRTAYREQLAGQSPDVRGAEAAHKASVQRATQAARALIEWDGGKASAAVMQSVRETLDILPGRERPGRLTRPLERTGFEALEGFTFAAKPRPVPTRLEPRTGPAKPHLTEAEKRASEAAERARAPGT